MRLLAAVALALSLTAPAVSSAATSRPSLRLAATAPLRLVGRDFRVRERVTVTVVVSGARRLLVARTSARGEFAVTVAGERPFDPCSDSLTAHAVGARGDEATLKIVERQCPPVP